jgi:hypothetical protein
MKKTDHHGPFGQISFGFKQQIESIDVGLCYALAPLTQLTAKTFSTGHPICRDPAESLFQAVRGPWPSPADCNGQKCEKEESNSLFPTIPCPSTTWSDLFLIFNSA